MKVFETAKPGQPLTQVSEKSLELQIDREHPEGAFSDPSMDTQEMDRVRLARSPKDTEKSVFRARKGAFPRGSKAGEDNSEKPYTFEGLYLSSKAQRDVWAESQPCYSQAARMKRDVSGLSSFCTIRSETRQAIAP